MNTIYKLQSPFRVISNVTDYAYWIKEIEVNSRGTVINYIIDGRTWSPDRFRGNKPKEYKVVDNLTIDEKTDIDYILDTLEEIEKDFEKGLSKLYDIKNKLEEIENEKEK